nr:unnamed protein product [Digitaria exilis]
MAAAGNGEATAPPPPRQQEPAPAAGSTSGGGVIASLEEQWRKTKEHAETYPYVWGSYILVYGGLGAYLAWRWGKLRRTEDRVRVLQERLRKLAAAEESQAASSSASTAPIPPPPQQPGAGPAKPASGPLAVLCLHGSSPIFLQLPISRATLHSEDLEAALGRRERKLLRAMPQVDLESLVCGVSGAGAGDRKVSCETVIAAGSGDASPPWMPPPPPPDPDFPPDSITIPIGDEAAFVDLNPIIYERDDSTKGSTNPKFASAVVSHHPTIAAKTRSNSTRATGGAPAAAAGTTFFGLPAKIRPAFSRRRPSQGRILSDKRAGGGEGEVEPRSPKVSCIGKGAAARAAGGGTASRPFGSGASRKKMALGDDHDGDEQQPGIAGMRRFKSGRRAASWGDEALAAAVAAAEEEDEEEREKADSEDAEQWLLRGETRPCRRRGRETVGPERLSPLGPSSRDGLWLADGDRRLA